MSRPSHRTLVAIVLLGIVLPGLMTSCAAFDSLVNTADKIDRRNREIAQQELDNRDWSMTPEIKGRLADQMAYQLTRELPEKDFVKSSPTRIVLAVGQFKNATQTPDPAIHGLLESVRQRLAEDSRFTDNVKVVVAKASMLEAYEKSERPAGVFEEDDGDIDSYSAEHLYFLQTNFDESTNDNTTTYTLGYSLAHAKTREPRAGGQVSTVRTWDA